MYFSADLLMSSSETVIHLCDLATLAIFCLGMCLAGGLFDKVKGKKFIKSCAAFASHLTCGIKDFWLQVVLLLLINVGKC